MSIETLTFGCRLNIAESAAMRKRAEEAGLDDAILVNTCAVTKEAVRQARQAIRRARRENPNTRIVVSGCAAQIEPETFAKMPEVDLVLGNAEKLAVDSYRLAREGMSPNIDVVIAAPGLDPGVDPAIHSVPVTPTIDGSGMDARIKSGHDDTGRTTPHTESTHFGVAASEKILVGDIFSVRETAMHMLDAFDPADENRTRAFVQIQNGCDHRCTFCIIPFGRGRSRSVPMGAIVNEIRRLVAIGYREVVLTGVDITAWGADLPGQPKLGALVRKILKFAPELPRLRLSSIDSVEADADLYRALREEERLMPHLHLSLQSGDDVILKRMKRRHSRVDAIRFCDEARKLRPDIVFGADLIAGFPTETDAMFGNTAALIDECGLTFVHVFPYSARKNTPAAKMPQLDGDTIRTRAKALREKGDAILSSFLAREIGKTRSILVEKSGLGHTQHFAPVAFHDAPARGSIVSAAIASFDGTRLTARVPSPFCPA